MHNPENDTADTGVPPESLHPCFLFSHYSRYHKRRTMMHGSPLLCKPKYH
jgi:hypothetical protein